jgi:hypothetical protein
MIDDQLVIRTERLRDSVENFREELRARYRSASSPVRAEDAREQAARLAERWLVEVATREDVKFVIGDETLADLNIQFQRLLTYSEQLTKRQKYEAATRTILSDFRNRVIIPLKQQRGRELAPSPPAKPLTPVLPAKATRAFVGQSFSADDQAPNGLVQRFLTASGIEVVTGERPSAGSVSAKVRRRIEACELFVGIFTRRQRIARKPEWTTSAWVVDEKAYALAKEKKLVLIKEVGVQSIGGIQGDYEYLEFEREEIAELLIKLVQLFHGPGD